MEHNNKYLYLVIGVIIGIAIGAAVVWWMQNYNFKIWFTFSGKNDNTTEFVDKQTKSNEEIESKQNASFTKTEKTKRNSASISQSDSLTNNYMNDVDRTDTVSNGNGDDEIVIAKDEFLFAKNIEIKGFTNQNNSNESNLDSLLINDKTQKASGNIVKVEFWRSPINYKGYKFINNKLILFGINNYDNANLVNRNGKIYLSYQNNNYLIEKNNDFQSLIPAKIQKPIKKQKK